MSICTAYCASQCVYWHTPCTVSGQEQTARGKQSMNWQRVCEWVCLCVCKEKHEG